MFGVILNASAYNDLVITEYCKSFQLFNIILLNFSLVSIPFEFKSLLFFNHFSNFAHYFVCGFLDSS